MKNNILFAVLFFVTSLSLVSCEKYSEDESESNQEANSTLVVRTRAAAENGDGEEAKISYPVNVYVFNSNDKCVAVSTLADETTQMELKLAEGNYSVYAIAGADESGYELPTKDNATKETVISLKDGKNHVDLMAAESSVNLTYGEENTLTLSLKRKVMLLETVMISGVPTTVTAVSVTISPLYENILLNGSYSGDNGSQTIELSEGTDGTTWSNTCNTYLLEASGTAAIKVSFTTASGVISYSYSSTDELKANYKININGTYAGGDLTLKGTVTGATWEGTKNINFSFDESGSTKDETKSGEDETNGSNDSGNETAKDAPAVGSIYNDCYVLKSETSNGTTTVTLMSTGYKDKLSFTSGDQSSMKTAVDKAISELSVSGIDGWRLPSLTEITYVKDNLSTINANLEANGKDRVLYSNYYHYYLTDESTISVIDLKDGYTIESTSSGKSSYILRAFTTVVFQ